MGFTDDEKLPEARPSQLPWLLAFLAVGAAVLLFFSLWKPREVDTSPNGPRHPAALAKVKLTELDFQPLLDADGPLTSEDLAGQVTLVNFWGPWCGPCGIEFPHLMQLREEFKGEKEFRFVSVSCLPQPGDELTIADDTQAFLKGQATRLPVYVDQNFRSRRHLLKESAMSPKEFGYPATVVLDRNGVIQGFWVDYRPGWELEMAEIVRKTLK